MLDAYWDWNQRQKRFSAVIYEDEQNKQISDETMGYWRKTSGQLGG